MTAPVCPREEELLEAVASGRWPDGCDAVFHGHVSQCAVCSEIAEVSVALRGDAEAAGRDAAIPSAGLVWWRAELRLRSEAAQAATKPISIVQAIAAASAVGVGVAMIGSVRPWLPEWRHAFEVVSTPFRAGIADLTMVPLAALAIVVCLALAPVAVYLATLDD